MITKDKIKTSFANTKTDKGWYHNYEKWYEKIFENFTPKSLLEIGIKEGRSLASWKDLFPECDITGIDISKKSFIDEFIKKSQANIIICDATKKSLLEKIDKKYDVIIDDASHYYEDILKTFDLLKDHFEHCYVIEDSIYFQEETVKIIESYGFRVEKYPSGKQAVPVNQSAVNRYIKNVSYVEKVDLYMIVVYRQ